MPSDAAANRPFGAESRRVLLAEFFAGRVVPAAAAWQDVYRLLLWIDRTTGLAHCYESDKAQPGRPWYARSLAFHDWVAKNLGVMPAAVPEEIDWLFRRGTERLAQTRAERERRYAEAAAGQRAPYEGRGFPEPGEDPELEALIREQLGEHGGRVPDEVLRQLVRLVQEYLGQENKRKNLVGEGFEDTIGAIVRRLPVEPPLEVRLRSRLHDLPGFREPPGREKPRVVDLAVLPRHRRRVLASVKWSIRADREEQFSVDIDAYTRMESAGEDFDFVLITNEFDAARLVAACDRRHGNRPLFSSVVHVSPAAVMTVHGTEPRGAAQRLEGLVDDGRLASLGVWLDTLTP